MGVICLFVYSIFVCCCFQTMLRIWDTFLYEGSKVLFRYAIAIFKYNEEGLMAMENSISIFNRLRTMAQSAVDVNRLTHVRTVVLLLNLSPTHPRFPPFF